MTLGALHLIGSGRLELRLCDYDSCRNPSHKQIDNNHDYFEVFLVTRMETWISGTRAR